MRVDLHVHTQESDGSLPVQDVLELAYDNGVRILSITDHESTQGVAKAQALSSIYGIKIIPGVELLTSYCGHEVHLLGYYNSVENESLQSRLHELRAHRTALAYVMVERLRKDGWSLRWEDVEREVGSEGAVSKGHIMRAVYHGGLLPSPADWHDIVSCFQPGGVAYLPFIEHPFEEAVDLIYETGGIPVLAHPGLLREAGLVYELLKYKPIGLEVYYGYWKNRESLIDYYAALAREHAVLATGGSDYHGPFSQVQIGEVDVPQVWAQTLKEYLGIRD